MNVTSFQQLPVRSADAFHQYARIHSFESMGTVDGPGTRFVIFMQGCLFRCKYCHNRDTWDRDAGKLYSVADLMSEIIPYMPFIDASGGGVTVSGGEPLLQREFVSLLFKMLNYQGIHTVLDTNGFVPASSYDTELEKLVARTDLFLLDIKHIDEGKHLALTSISNRDTLNFARYLKQKHKPARIRHVVVPGYTTDTEDIKRLVDFIAKLDNVVEVELLPYHTLGAHKWQAFEGSYPLQDLKAPSKSQMEEIKQLFSVLEVPVF